MHSQSSQRPWQQHLCCTLLHIKSCGCHTNLTHCINSMIMGPAVGLGRLFASERFPWPHSAAAAAVSWCIVWMCALQCVYGCFTDGDKSSSGAVPSLPSSGFNWNKLQATEAWWETHTAADPTDTSQWTDIKVCELMLQCQWMLNSVIHGQMH